MSAKRQKNQLVLAFAERDRSEAPKAPREGTEAPTAKCDTERPASHEQLMEEVCERRNCWQAYKRVKANKGSPGIDGMTIGDLAGRRRPVKPPTISGWQDALNAWLLPNLGEKLLADVSNAAMRQLVEKMSNAGLSPKTIVNYVRVAIRGFENVRDLPICRTDTRLIRISFDFLRPGRSYIAKRLKRESVRVCG